FYKTGTGSAGLGRGFIFALGICSLLVKERLYISATLLAMLYGIAIGPLALNWIDPQIEYSRYCLAIELMIAGITLPKKYLSGVAIYGYAFVPVMTLMWLVSAAIIKFTFGLPFLQALAIGACVAPTDPVLANAILKGMFAETHVPLRLRNILTAESGANDGLGYPFLFLALFLMRLGGGNAIGAWFYVTWVYQVVLRVAGYVGRKVLKYAKNTGWIEHELFLLSAISLALMLVGLCTILGTDDILCCFVAGNSFTWDDWYRIESEDTLLQQTINDILSMTFFIANFLSPWRISIAVVLIIILRRLPAIVALYRLVPAINNWKEALFAGWFGPIGVSAIFYATETIKQINEHDDSNAGIVAKIVYPIVCAVCSGRLNCFYPSSSSIWNIPNWTKSKSSPDSKKLGANHSQDKPEMPSATYLAPIHDTAGTRRTSGCLRTRVV
ncbi:Sodium/hydrogen exchanger family-domain-containing protein, partial [Kickxella alabastrina]|uniref:Sodium/hydrogen exchanger family-domain-containing protein n=1 Tax=Kickxella alabastrina TaxID=61397 RepID=UPI00221F4F3C